MINKKSSPRHSLPWAFGVQRYCKMKTIQNKMLKNQPQDTNKVLGRFIQTECLLALASDLYLSENIREKLYSDKYKDKFVGKRVKKRIFRQL